MDERDIMDVILRTTEILKDMSKMIENLDRRLSALEYTPPKDNIDEEDEWVLVPY